jgi:hypothetical protein
MCSLQDIEKAIEALPPAEYNAFRRWFEEFSALRFDERIERDAETGLLDRFADEALREAAGKHDRPL